jgi:hypothetical protein
MPIIYEAQPVFDGAERVSTRQSAQAIRANERMRSVGGEAVAQALEHIGGTVNGLIDALGRTVNGVFDEITVTDAATGAIIGWIGTNAATGAQGGWFYELYAAGDGPDTAPFVVQNGRLTITLGDDTDAAVLTVKDGSGNVVVQAGLFDGEYGIAAQNLWLGPDADPATAVLWSNGTGTFIGENGFIELLDADGNPNAWIGARTFSAVDYAGGHVVEWRIGGDVADPTTAVIVADVNGDVTIAGGDVYLGPGATGDGGRLFGYTGTDLTAWIGSGDIAASVAITNVVAGTVTTGAAHGLLVGDWTFIEGTSNAAHRGIWEVATVPGATSFTATGLSGNSTGGTSTKQQTGAWFAEIRAAGTGPADALIVGDDTGLTIGDAAGSRIEVDASGNVELIDASISVANTNYTVSLNAGSTFKVTNNNTAADQFEITLVSDELTFVFRDKNGVVRHNIFATHAGNSSIQGTSFVVGASTVIDSSTNASFNSLSLSTDLTVANGGTGASTAAGARTNLSVYSIAEVDTLLAGYLTQAQADLLYSPLGHGHTGSIVAVGNHTHGGVVVGDGGHTHTITIT